MSMSKQRGFTEFSVFLKRVGLLNPRARTNFVAFPLEPGKSLEVSSILDRDQALVNNCSAAARGALNWIGRSLNSSFLCVYGGRLLLKSKGEEGPPNAPI